MSYGTLPELPEKKPSQSATEDSIPPGARLENYSVVSIYYSLHMII